MIVNKMKECIPGWVTWDALTKAVKARARQSYRARAIRNFGDRGQGDSP